MSLDLSFERVIAAPPERVFELFTAPEGQSAFYGNDDPGWIVESECDLRVGGAWSIRFGPSRDELYEHHHVFATIDPPRRVATTCTEVRLDGSTFDTTVEFLFAPHERGTLMTMHHAGFPSQELRDEHTRGLPHAFDRFDRLFEQGA